MINQTLTLNPQNFNVGSLTLMYLILCYKLHDIHVVTLLVHVLDCMNCCEKRDSGFMITTETDNSLHFGQAQRYLES